MNGVRPSISAASTVAHTAVWSQRSSCPLKPIAIVMNGLRIAATGLDPASYGWYRDLRRYGTVPHAGFGLGFERTLAYVTGLANVRDTIPFPRTPGNARY